MLTVFSVPKAFRGHIDIIQRNAITSWTLLEPRPEIVLLGNEEGTAQVARKLGLRHIPEISANERGTPLLSDLFRRAERNARSEWMCYVNADILVLSDFARAVGQVQKKIDKSLIVSKRINVDIPEAMSFEANWEASLKKLAAEAGTSGDHTTIDVFVFPKGTYAQMPDFGVGRLWFDQWLIRSARQRKIPVVDVSPAAVVIHQNHVAGGADQVWRGEEAAYNLRLYGDVEHAWTLLNATHELTNDGTLQRVWFRKPLFETRKFFWDLFIRRTVRLRDALRLRKKFWLPVKSKNT
jgi:hypothetical protein